MVLAADKVFSNFSNVAFDAILNKGMGAATALTNLGIGIASIFLLFVVFHHVSSILDGGQFQSKMLWPLVLYMLICNFGIVSGVAKTFITTINKEAATAALEVKYSEMGSNQSLLQYFYERSSKPRMNAELQQQIDKIVAKKLKDAGHHDPTGKANNEGAADMANDNNGNKNFWEDSGVGSTVAAIKEGFGKLNIREALDDWWFGIRYFMIEEWVLWKDTDAGIASFVAWVLQTGFTALLALVIQWILSIVAFLMSAFGAVLGAVIIAFGPITWAFAIFPGNGRTIGTWFIRLTQFSLYGPIVFLINSFCVVLLGDVMEASAGALTVENAFLSGSVTTIGIIAILILNIVCLASVPTLATMIVEGAQGAFSLVGNISTFTSIGGSLSQMGESKRDKEMLEAIKSNNGGGSGGGSNSGGSGGGFGPFRGSGPLGQRSSGRGRGRR